MAHETEVWKRSQRWPFQRLDFGAHCLTCDWEENGFLDVWRAMLAAQQHRTNTRNNNYKEHHMAQARIETSDHTTLDALTEALEALVEVGENHGWVNLQDASLIEEGGQAELHIVFNLAPEEPEAPADAPPPPGDEDEPVELRNNL